MSIVVETKQLCKYYGSGENIVKAVNKIDLQINQGVFSAIVGKSGSGKSTLLHMLGGLDVPTSGEIMIDGEAIGGFSEEKLAIFRRRKIGFVFQDFNLIPALNVWENIVLPICLEGRRPDGEFIDDILNTLGIMQKKNKLPATLSGGEQQRVAIARAIASRPVILLADEPTGNLDSKTSGEVMMLLRQSAQKYGQTLIMITHDDEIAQMADDIIQIEDGGIKA